MSLAIDVDRVSDVLLADGWHRCDWRDEDGRQVSTLMFDAYEYLWRPDPRDEWRVDIMAHGIEGLVPHTGFCFEESGIAVYGPLTAILAVRTRRT